MYVLKTMTPSRGALCCLLAVPLLVSDVAEVAGLPAVRPHLVMILADDLGFGNVGWNRARYASPTPEVQTPRLDALVADGIELQRFYVYHMCSPTRSALQTGRHPMHVNIVNADPTIYNASDSTGTGAGIPRNMTGLATKLRLAGYRTHMVGKWDAGMATPTHTPQGRGYETSLGYFHHANNYWSDETGDKTCPVGADLWDTDKPAHSMVPQDKKIDRYNESAYEEHFLMQRVSSIINSYVPSAQSPLFLFYAAHLVHDPLEVPQPYLDRLSKAGGGPFQNSTENDNTRMTYHAMVTYLDENVGRIVDQLKSKQMWQSTLLLFVSDNGGPIYGGGNNYPLRGGKYSEFEGGVRVAAFASGGAIPKDNRGVRRSGLAAIADVYVTFCAIAGVDANDTLARGAGLPPVDGVDLRPLLFGSGQSPRTEVPLMPMSLKDVAALDAYDKFVAVSPPPGFDVHIGAACGSTGPNKIKFIGNTTLAACEAACASDPACQMFSHRDDGVAAPAHFCALHNVSTTPIRNPKFDCGCRGKCPAQPGPQPGPKPGPSHHSKCNKLQGWDYLDHNLTVTTNVDMNDCCDICNTTRGCAVSVWYPKRTAPHSNGTCVTKSSRSQPINGDDSVAWLPGDVPVPPPVIGEQAGLVIGDMKLITGKQVSMAVFTGPHFPNSSTPWTNNNSIKVPAFECSRPLKTGCLFNVTADPSEHLDLWQELPDIMASMLSRLREISRTRFDPLRGDGDKRACRQMAKNADSRKVGFFGPWLP